MPIIKSAQKRMRQESVRRARNRQTKDEMRDAIKKFGKAIDTSDDKAAAAEFPKVQSQLSRAVKKNLLHKNTAARKLSSLNAKLKALKPAKVKTTKTAK